MHKIGYVNYVPTARAVVTWPQDASTALMFAASGGHTQCCETLIVAGADVNAKNGVRTCYLAVVCLDF